MKEAAAFEPLNRRVMAETVERECCAMCYDCPRQLRDATRELLRFARMHVDSLLTSLARLAAGLERVAAPKTIILVSAGLPFEQESLTRFTEAQRALTRAEVMMCSGSPLPAWAPHAASSIAFGPRSSTRTNLESNRRRPTRDRGGPSSGREPAAERRDRLAD